MSYQDSHDELVGAVDNLTIEGGSVHSNPPDESSGSSEDSGIEPVEIRRQVFPAFIRFFDKVETDWRGKIPVEGWRDILGRVSDGADLKEGFETIFPIILYLENQYGHSALSELMGIFLHGSRYEPCRFWYGITGILELCLDIFNKERNDGWWDSDFIRWMANSCIGSDANRARVIAKFDLVLLVKEICDQEKGALAVTALWNICCEYEPAQDAASSHKLFQRIIFLFKLRDRPLDSKLFSQVCELLNFALDNFDASDLPDDAVEVIYNKLSTRMVHFDDKVAMCSAILVLLQCERYQKLAIARDSMPLLMALMSDTYKIDFNEVSREGDSDLPDMTIDRRETIKLMRANFSERIMDLSEWPEFSTRYLPSSTIVEELCMWLEEGERMQECACYVLRNVMSTTEKAMQFVQDERGRSRLESLTRLLIEPISTQVARQGLRLLKHLAQTESNKVALSADPMIMVAVVLLCSDESHLSVQHDALTTTRVLLSGSFSNVRLFLRMFTGPTTFLTHLLSLYTRHQDLNIRMELGLLMIEICKVAFKETDEVSRLNVIVDTINLAREADLNAALPIAALITDSNNPSLVTKGWLGLALLAFSPEGSDEVYNYLDTDQTFQRLKEIIRRQKPRSQDQDNVRVLHARLRIRYLNTSQDERVAILEDLISGMQELANGNMSNFKSDGT